MKLFHTSPEKIEKISKFGMFGECLFFSSSVYVMTAVEDYITYSIEINEDDVIEVGSFFHHDEWEKLNDIVQHIMDVCECDEEEAQDYLDGSEHHEDGEMDWMIQGLQGDAAKVLGYRAAQSEDEQGAVYIVPMFGRESELKLEEEA